MALEALGIQWYLIDASTVCWDDSMCFYDACRKGRVTRGCKWEKKGSRERETEKDKDKESQKLKVFDKQSLHAVTMMLLLWFQSDVDDSVAILI